MVRRFTLAAATLAAAGLLAACGGPAGVADLEVGDCLTRDSLGQGPDLTEVQTVACTDPHELEVFGVVTLEDSDWPGAQALTADSMEQCIGLFEDYVGASYPTSDVVAWTLHPTEDGWAEGDRGATCIAETETRTTSVQGSGE